MRVLITGACGLLGAHLAAYCQKQHQVLGCDRHPWWGDQSLDLLEGDLSDSSFLHKAVRQFSPQVVVHCAAATGVDACEKDAEAAFRANAEVTKQLVETLEAETLLVYISTDAVFGNGSAFAQEAQLPSPGTVYGRSKLKGEQEAAAMPNHLIIRTNFYGWSSGRKRTFAEWLWNALEQREPITLFNDFFYTPIYVADLAERLEKLILSGERGIVHLPGSDRVSKYDFGKRLAQLGGLSFDAVEAGSLNQAGLGAQRGNELSLAGNRYEQITRRKAPSLDDGLKLFLSHRGVALSERWQQEVSSVGGVS